MDTITSYKPGSFCWAELAAKDAKKAKSFYSALLNWTLTDNPMGPDMVYTRATIDGKGVCGLYEMPGVLAILRLKM